MSFESPTAIASPSIPISSGKNWGYGSRVPPRDGVLVDLGRLNRIVDFSEELAYVTVEPGVTQRQLYQFLPERSSQLWMDATGASPDCSIVGNTMERGFGHTPMGDHCSNVCGLEVVLGSGDVIETGFARFDNGRTGALQPLGRRPVARRALLAVPPRHRHAHDHLADAGARAVRSVLFQLPEGRLAGSGDRCAAAVAHERHAAQRDPHRQRLQGARGHEPVSVGRDRGPHAARGRCDGRASGDGSAWATGTGPAASMERLLR